jgi:hypothetical protein
MPSYTIMLQQTQGALLQIFSTTGVGSVTAPSLLSKPQSVWLGSDRQIKAATVEEKNLWTEKGSEQQLGAKRHRLALQVIPLVTANLPVTGNTLWIKSGTNISLHSAVSTVSMLCADNPKFKSWQEQEIFFPQNIHTKSKAHPAFHSMGTRSFYLGQSSQSMKLTIHYHLVPRLRITETILLLTFMPSWSQQI